MGDLMPDSRSQTGELTTGLAHADHQNDSMYKAPDNNTPFYSQLSSIPHGQIRPEHRPSAYSPAYYPAQQHSTSAFAMGSMAAALPGHPSDAAPVNHQSSQSTPRSISGASTSALVYQLGQNLQMPAHPPGSLHTHASYISGYGTNSYPQGFMPAPNAQHNAFSPYPTNQAHLPAGLLMHNPYQQYQPSQYMYYPTHYAPQGHSPVGYMAQGSQVQSMFGRRESMTAASYGMPAHNLVMPHYEGGYAGVRTEAGHVHGDPSSMGATFGPTFHPVPGVHRSASVSSIPRGPPRKPKQSGHALWVGNLPPGTTVIALKEHFSREATKDIESLFLISKSNCAFVNYRTEPSCTAAMHRFHDSRFNGVRLVCRLRRSSTLASGVPTGPSAMVGSQQIHPSPPTSPKQDIASADSTQDSVAESQPHTGGDETEGASTVVSKYFIVKSLTLQDLELSVRNGIWATQSHNEDVLNKAFQTAENVYLVFSANKSGEYFGYARMASPILEDGHELTGTPAKTESIADAPDVPKSISTPATEWAPKGRIIDDSARGTIFWEAELSESEGEEEVVEKVEPKADEDSTVIAQSWGKPFRIEWLSANRLPFYRTRGLRNPWNANREVKIARDGTELEPSVGERLIQMFHRMGPASGGAHMMGPVIPQMRPF